MKKVIITDHGFPHVDLERGAIESAGFAFEVIQPICKTEDDIIRTCGDADALLVQWAPVTRRVLEALPKVRCIVRYGVGVNNFDLDAAKDLGVVAANVPDFCLDEVANHAMAMILSLVRRIPQDHHQILQGGWGVNPFRPIYAPTELTLGLVSFGKIARNLARKAAVFNQTSLARGCSERCARAAISADVATRPETRASSTMYRATAPHWSQPTLKSAALVEGGQ